MNNLQKFLSGSFAKAFEELATSIDGSKDYQEISISLDIKVGGKSVAGCLNTMEVGSAKQILKAEV